MITFQVIFTHQIISDFKSNKRHYMKYALKVSSLTYNLTKFILNFVIYIIIVLASPMSLYLSRKYKDPTDYYYRDWMLDIEIMTKLSFGFFIIPFLQFYSILVRNQKNSILQYLWVILFILSHVIAMIMRVFFSRLGCEVINCMSI